ncbi:MAG: azurin [Bacteroidota bacterium]
MKQIGELLAITLLVFASTVLFTGCGGRQEKSNESTTQVPESPQDGIVKLVVNSDDLMRYDIKELRVPEGVSVELTLNHTGQLAKEAMGHNIVILKSGTDMAAFAQKAIDAKDNDYIPEGDDIIAHTALIGGGESTRITFEAPAPGSYEFLCSFPGHWGLMQGKFVVE